MIIKDVVYCENIRALLYISVNDMVCTCISFLLQKDYIIGERIVQLCRATRCTYKMEERYVKD